MHGWYLIYHFLISITYMFLIRLWLTSRPVPVDKLKNLEHFGEKESGKKIDSHIHVTRTRVHLTASAATNQPYQPSQPTNTPFVCLFNTDNQMYYNNIAIYS